MKYKVHYRGKFNVLTGDPVNYVILGNIPASSAFPLAQDLARVEAEIDPLIFNSKQTISQAQMFTSYM